jgi:spermidine synthase
MGPLSPRRACLLAFTTAAVTLFTQVLAHRIVAAKLLNNFAFLIISLTMLGFALSGVVLTRWLPALLPRVREALNLGAVAFAITLVGCSAAFYAADTGAQYLVDFGRWLPLSLLFALPFAFCGLSLGLLLSAPELPTRRIYAFDLAGSAVGAFAVIPAISAGGVEASLLGGAGLLLVATLALAPPRRSWARATVAGGLVVLALGALFRGRLFDMYYPDASLLADARKPGSRLVIEHVVWDPVARIEVSRIPPPDPGTMFYPSHIGSNREFLGRIRRVITQNNWAFTYAVDYDGRRESLAGLEDTIYASAYEATAVTAPRVVVIGVGGGYDLLTALYFGAREVTGVEINAATVRILTDTYRDYFRSWVSDPRVRLVNAEGRNYLATHDDRYDVIQLSGVDSYAGTAAAAHVFSESYLYTGEAFDLYLSRLADDGILAMMRLEFVPPREMLRALATAVAALRRAGIAHPAEHVITLTQSNGRFTSMLVQRRPFTSGQVRRVAEWASHHAFFGVSAAPGLNGGQANAYQALLRLDDPRREAAFVRAYPLAIAPVDDDRPFFFRYSAWSELGGLLSRDPWVRSRVPPMEQSLLALCVVIGAAALLCVQLPLRLMSRRPPRSPRHAVFFAGLGLGYMAVEIALLQRFGLFLGHPNYALSVVLASLLLASGLGAVNAPRIMRALGGVRFVAYALSGVILVEALLALPRLPRLLTLPFPARVALTFLLVLPIGVGLGTFLPTGLEDLKRERPEAVPWAWGVNGVFSVLGPVLAVAFSITWGMRALLLAAVVVYLAAALAYPGMADAAAPSRCPLPPRGEREARPPST